MLSFSCSIGLTSRSMNSSSSSRYDAISGGISKFMDGTFLVWPLLRRVLISDFVDGSAVVDSDDAGRGGADGHLMASGLIGEPTAFVNLIGGAAKKNSHTP